MTYRYLGYGVTNSDEIAKLEYDSNGDPIEHSYTGVGAGKINIVSSLDSTITESSIISPACIISDCLEYDKGTLNEHNDLFNAMRVFTRNTDDTTVYYDNTSGASAFQTYIPSISFNGDDYTIELEVTRSNRLGVQVALYETGEDNYYDNYSGESLQGTGTFKWVFQADGKVYWYKNDQLFRTSNSTNTERFSLFFRAGAGTILDFNYKNLKIYPI